MITTENQPAGSIPFMTCTPTTSMPASTDLETVARGAGKNAGREIQEWQAIMDHFLSLPVAVKGE